MAHARVENVSTGLTRLRAPARPGPGPMPLPLLRALDLEVRRRIEGLLPGDFSSAATGTGTELALVRPYVAGDDVRQMEWNVTARTGQPHVREQVAEKTLTAWLLLDVSASMNFGTARRRKADVAEGVVLALGHLASRRGNRLGTMTFGAGRDRVVTPSDGRRGMLGLLHTLARLEQTDATTTADLQHSLGRALRRATRMARTRGTVWVVSDWRSQTDWRRPLGQLVHRHEVIAVEIQDPREQELPNVGDLWLVDPETGRQMRVDTGDRKLRRDFSAAAAGERAQLHRDLMACGARHVVLSTSEDWLHTLAGFLTRGYKGVTGGARAASRSPKHP
ncbi:MAG: DUF58 domain-containing protein [Actinomycetota bacterium]|nr:DUF58 domain-containing protein [Actinomycetota bacterium]